MAYEMVMPYHLHMPSYFLETFTEYPLADAGSAVVLLYIHYEWYVIHRTVWPVWK